MSVRLSVRSHISKTACPNFTKFSVRVTSRYGSVLFWRQCNTLCTSGFVADVMFSHNGTNGPESKKTRVSCTSPDGGTGAKSATSDGLLGLCAIVAYCCYIQLLVVPHQISGEFIICHYPQIEAINILERETSAVVSGRRIASTWFSWLQSQRRNAAASIPHKINARSGRCASEDEDATT